MTEPGSYDAPGVCLRCHRSVTTRMPRVLTADGAYHHRCYLPARAANGSSGSRARARVTAPPWSDRLAPLLERLAQAVIIVIVIGTALIVLGHVLP